MSFKTFNQALNTEQLSKVIPRAGHALLVRRASDADAVISATFRGGPADGETLLLRIGDGWRFVPYERIELSWDEQPDAWVELIAWGDPEGSVGNEPEFYVSPTPLPVAV